MCNIGIRVVEKQMIELENQAAPRRRMRLGASSAFFVCLLLGAACDKPRKPANEPTGPDPLATVRTLLGVHDLLGKQPEERSDETRHKEVDRKLLEPLFKDLDNGDPFISNLYVGFIVGALARNQGRLYVAKRGVRAEITAGDVRVVLLLDGDKWKIALGESIPQEIVKRAQEEKIKFDEAKKRASGADRS
jgi:hypothetical protein